MNNDKIKVTVCICTYNRMHLLGRCIESVVNQTHQNIDVIIVDDCSEDSTEEVVKKYLVDNRVRYFRNVTNKGLSENRNKAISEAKGEYFTFVDDDDYWDENYIQNHINAISNFSSDTITCGGYRTFYKNAIIEYYLDVNTDLKTAILNGYTPPVGNQFYPISVLKMVGGYTLVKSGVDHDLWIKLSQLDLKLYSLSNGLTYINNESEIGKTMTSSPKKRISGVNNSILIWKDILTDLAPNFYEHFVKSYEYNHRSKFFLLYFKNRYFKKSFNELRNIPFKIFFVKNVLVRIIQKIYIKVSYYVFGKRVIRIKIRNSFPKYR